MLDPARRRRETRRLKVLIGTLALTTAGLGLLLYPTLGFVTLLAPFVVLVLSCALVLPLDGYDLDQRQTAMKLQAARQRDAARHSMAALATPSVAGHARASGLHRAAQEAEAETFAHTCRAIAAAEQAHGIHFASAHLPDEEFYRSFTAGELRAQDFRHGDHLRFAWLVLERLPLGMAEESIAQALRQFLRRISASNAQFHATHTHGWFAVLASLPQRTFAEALAAHAHDLRSDGLTRFWSQAVLDSPAARATAPPPDVRPLPLPDARRTRRYRAGNTSLPPAPHAPVLN